MYRPHSYSDSAAQYSLNFSVHIKCYFYVSCCFLFLFFHANAPMVCLSSPVIASANIITRIHTCGKFLLHTAKKQICNNALHSLNSERTIELSEYGEMHVVMNAFYFKCIFLQLQFQKEVMLCAKIIKGLDQGNWIYFSLASSIQLFELKKPFEWEGHVFKMQDKGSPVASSQAFEDYDDQLDFTPVYLVPKNKQTN